MNHPYLTTATKPEAEKALRYFRDRLRLMKKGFTDMLCVRELFEKGVEDAEGRINELNLNKIKV